jgi:phosphopantetheine adenylyltransferase
MKKFYTFAALSAGALMITACSGGADESSTTSEATEEVASGQTSDECTQESATAKVQALSEKMQGLANDPAAMQEMAAKLQEIQEKVQAGAADGSFDLAAACAVYDEMLAAAE